MAGSESTSGAALTDEQRIDWLRLIRSDHVGPRGIMAQTPGVCAIIPGPRTFYTLVNHFGGARAALKALPDLARRGGADRPARACPREDAERELETARRLGIAFVALGEPAYPSRLQAIDDPPPLIAVKGQLVALAQPMAGMVGSRNASAAGCKIAERLARDLGQAGLVIASGLARGIDAAAHRGSLATGTVAVLAGGLDRIYPEQHTALLDSILHAGAALSEMPLGYEPRARDFPRRNRLISGLSLGVVVVEAAKRSGSLITARMALEQGREVFAVPGSPLDPRAEGTNGLLKQGAILVTEAADVVSVLQPILGRRLDAPVEEPEPDPLPSVEPGANERARIIGLLGPTPVAVDDLVRLSGGSPATVRMVLLEIEIAGRLERHGAELISLS